MGAKIELVRFKVSDQPGLSRYSLLTLARAFKSRLFGQVRDEILCWNSLSRLERAVLGCNGDGLCRSEYGEAEMIVFQLKYDFAKHWRLDQDSCTGSAVGRGLTRTNFGRGMLYFINLCRAYCVP